MMQVLQDLQSGRTLVEDVPAPLCGRGRLRISTAATLVSAGTERMLVDFARGSPLSKARQQPEKVREVLQKVRTDGLATTIEAVRAKLSEPMALGYCNVGRVLETGEGVAGFAPGDRVISNGRHAEVVVAPHTLCARVPDEVSDESAAFTVLGAVALQGVRLAAPTLGEAFVVTGLGLIGLMSVQMLRANGCRVLGIDTDPERLALARRYGAETVDLSRGEDPLIAAAAFSRGRGVDGVLLTLSTKSDQPVSDAAKMCRKRGRIILVGVTGLAMNRADFYEKELSFQVSCSYGPGRYDPTYEEKGQDYPFGFVRWTEQRNFEAVLDMMASGALEVGPLVSHRFRVDEAQRAYDVLAGEEPSLGILLTFPGEAPGEQSTRVALSPDRTAAPPSKGVVSFIGAGNYGGRILAKAFAAADAELDTIVSSSGVSAVHHGRKAGFRQAASDAAAALGGAADTVCIATRHDSHARYVEAALAAGKHVFVEKPLCLRLDELERIGAAAGRPEAPLLMVGFNRRFAPLVRTMKALLDATPEAKAFTLTVNAGRIPNESWVQDPEIGGGRLLGEACHFIDLLRHLAGAPIAGFDVTGLDLAGGPPRTDVASVTLRFEDGSFGVINYLANGHKGLAKERLEVFCAGRVLALDNFLRLRGYGWRTFKGRRMFGQDKGQYACVSEFMRAVRTAAPAPIPLDEILEVSRVTIEIAAQAG